MGYASHAQRKAVWASKKDGGKGNPNKKSPAKMGPVAAMVAGKVASKVAGKVVDSALKMKRSDKTLGKYAKSKMNQSGSPFKLKPKSPLMGKISASCKARAKKKFKVWPSAYASGWGVRCTQGKV